MEVSSSYHCTWIDNGCHHITQNARMILSSISRKFHHEDNVVVSGEERQLAQEVFEQGKATVT